MVGLRETGPDPFSSDVGIGPGGDEGLSRRTSGVWESKAPKEVSTWGVVESEEHGEGEGVPDWGDRTSVLQD